MVRYFNCKNSLKVEHEIELEMIWFYEDISNVNNIKSFKQMPLNIVQPQLFYKIRVYEVAII